MKTKMQEREKKETQSRQTMAKGVRMCVKTR